MKRIQFLLILSILFCRNTNGQGTYELHPPLDTPIYLSATFGSLRENHFHSGMDLRTNEVEGLPVYAIDDGYVSRIKIQSGGYGKAIYITHPGGITSVYGHLSAFATTLHAYIHQYQYSNKTFEIDHYPSRDKLPVKKGEIIGYSGNTGTSSGPHLHFEIRDSRSEAINNPLAYGIPVLDTMPPTISRIVLYNLSGQHPNALFSIDFTSINTFRTDSGFWCTDSLIVPASVVGLGVIASDKMVLTGKEYSIYSLQLHADNKQLFKFQMDQFSFDRTRCVNTHIDYKEYLKSGERIQKLFLDDGNTISLYPYIRNKGKINTTQYAPVFFRIKVSDFAGHAVNYYIPVKYTSENSAQSPVSCSGTFAYPLTSTTINTSVGQILIPAGSLFDTTEICAELMPARNAVFPMIHIADANIPLYRNVHINMPVPPQVPVTLHDKLCMTWQAKENSQPRFVSAHTGGPVLKGKSSQFGYFSMKLDTTPPVIKFPTDIAVRLSGDTGSLAIIVTDDFSGLASYSATINGDWILLEYDAKSNTLIYPFDEVISRQHASGKPLVLLVTVTDRCGNKNQLKYDMQK